MIAILYAIDSGIALYDTTLFSLHMVQHLLLTLVGPPLLLLAGPDHAPAAGVVARDAPALHPARPPLAARRGWSRSRCVAWVLFAGVMWASHFSPLFDLALENPWIHRLEHLLFLTAALLFWWPVVGPDPSPWKLKPGAGVLYVGLQMPQNTFLALAIYLATAPALRPLRRRTSGRGVRPLLEDQQLAGGFMWFAGDLMFIAMVVLLTWVWMRPRSVATSARTARLEGERAAIREREVKLAARRAAEGPRPAVQAAAGRGRRRADLRLGRDRRLQVLEVALRVDVAAADDADDGSVEADQARLRRVEPHRRDDQRARRLDDQARLLGREPDGRRDLDLARP